MIEYLSLLSVPSSLLDISSILQFLFLLSIYLFSAATSLIQIVHGCAKKNQKKYHDLCKKNN